VWPGRCGRAIQRIEEGDRQAPSLATSFQGNAQAFEASLSGMPLLIGAALIVIYIISRRPL